tara:strand:+ start:4664 stop:5566 length:903 start_codon:yes stop_codon:yes gene_type:complete
VALVDEGNYKQALKEFESAYELAPHPLVLFNIAGAHRALKNYRQALDSYSRFLLEADGRLSSEILARGKRDMEELLSLLGRIEVDSSPQGASIVVDGEEMGTTPLGERLILAPGPHVLVAQLDGYKPLERTVRVSSGDELKLSLALVSLKSDVAVTEAEVEASDKGLTTPRSPRRVALSATFGTNTRKIATTGAPTLGASVALSGRLALGLDVVLVAYSAIPQVRFRIAGDAVSLHLIAAVPLSISDGDDSEFFVAGAGGLGVRYQMHERVGLRVEALVSYAGEERGLTIPAFAGAEVFF